MPPRPAGNEMPGPGVRAAIYCRISKADEGDMTKTDDQERICRDLADRLGWEVHGDVYTDHSKSAWQKNRKRPAWDQMLADVKAGKVNGIITYHGDRLVRRPEDLADLIRLADSKGVRLASPNGTRNLDNERLEPWIRAAFAEEESQRLSERRKAQYERWRRQGKVRAGGRGGRAFGFGKDGVTHVPAECGVIREAAARVLAAESLGSVVRDLTARGVLTTAGNPWTHKTLGRLLARPRLAGLMPDGESRAAWEPVLGRETWELLRLALDVKAAGFTRATSAPRWLLSGIVTCGACGSRLKANGVKDRSGAIVTGYACRKPGCRKVHRNAAHLDAYASAAVVARLAHPLNPRPDAPAEPGHGAEWAALAAERGRTGVLLADYAGGNAALLLQRLDAIDERMAQLRELADTSQRDRLLSRYRGITLKQFAALPLGVRRSLVRATVTVTVLPAPPRGPGFHPQDVRVEPVP